MTMEDRVRPRGKSGRPGWPGGGQLFGRGLALQGQREALIVIRPLPIPERHRGGVEVREALAAPELLVVDAVAPLDLPVLLRPSGADIPMPNAGRFHRERKRERELAAVVPAECWSGWWGCRILGPKHPAPRR